MRRALRQLIQRPMRSAPAPQPAPAPASGASAESILDAYVDRAPNPQNAIDVFAGEWSSRFPAPLADLVAGPVPLFEDDRLTWALAELGDVSGRRVLELGPLEGGHTWQLTEAGAEVTAIEANTRAYLKCLIVKELLGMDGAHFLLGDFLAYLRENPSHADLCLASGVLYHLRDPVELIALLAPAADRLVLWTHVYDDEVIAAAPELARRFTAHAPTSRDGLVHTLHRFEYAESLEAEGFCGGSARYASWLSRADLMAALEHFGWHVDAVAFDQPHHPHGPALALIASQLPASR